LDSLTRTVALPHILKLIVWTSIFHEPPKRVSKVLTASPRRPCDFSVEASGLPWLPCIWHRLARQGIAKASDGRCTRVKATHAEEKTRRRLAHVGEKEQAARAGNRAPILRAGCRIAAVQEGGERRKERRGGRGERTGRRPGIWADGIQLLQLLPPSARPPIQLCPLDSWRLPLHRLAPTPPSLLPNPVAPAPSPIDLHLLPLPQPIRADSLHSSAHELLVLLPPLCWYPSRSATHGHRFLFLSYSFPLPGCYLLAHLLVLGAGALLCSVVVLLI